MDFWNNGFLDNLSNILLLTTFYLKPPLSPYYRGLQKVFKSHKWYNSLILSPVIGETQWGQKKWFFPLIQQSIYPNF